LPPARRIAKRFKAMQPEQDAHNNGNDDKGDETERPATPITRTIIAIWVFIFLSGALWFITGDVFPDNLSRRTEVFLASIFSLAIVIVVVVQTAIYLRQAEALDAQLKISNATFTLLERPSVGIVNAELIQIKDSENRIVRFSIQNTGHLPARSLTTLTGAQISKSGTAQACGDLWPLLPLPLPGLISKGVIPVNSTFHSYALPSMTKAQFEPLANEGIWLYAYCRVEYGSDGKTRPYFTEYYARWSRYTGQFETCDKHNDAN
jgi:uncharacterized membrane protein YgcG